MGFSGKVKAKQDFHGAEGIFTANVKKGDVLTLPFSQIKIALGTGSFEMSGECWEDSPEITPEITDAVAGESTPKTKKGVANNVN